jgi:hypothetical protein
MITQKFRLLALFSAMVIAFAAITPALASAPIIYKEVIPYDLEYWSCGDFYILNQGEATHHVKITFDDLGVAHLNVQTTYDGVLINSSTRKYLVEKGNHTWNMLFEDNVSTNALNAGGSWRIMFPDGRLVWLDAGVIKFTGFTVDPMTKEINWGDPYLVTGHRLEDMETTICEALR